MLFAKYVIVFVFLAITFRQQWFVNLSYFLSVGFVILASILIVLIEFGVVRKWFIFFQLLSVGSFIEIILFTVLIIYRIRSVYLHRIELMHQLSEQKKRLIRAFVNGGDRERNFISQELHDNVGTKLVLLKNKLVSNYSTEFVPFVDSVIFDVRQLSHRISPSTLPLIGFKESLQGLIDECCTSSDITISLQFYNLPELSNDQSIPLFRIFQEALKNIVQHSNAHTVEIQLLGYSDQLVVTIDDDGKGIGTDSLKKAKGLGVSNMRSRVDSLGGTFELSSITGQGTSILISIPLTEKK
jgi:signal transduction histidine kinase